MQWGKNFKYEISRRCLKVCLNNWLTSIQEGNFNIVFAIKKDYEAAYKALARCRFWDKRAPDFFFFKPLSILSEIPGQAHVAVLEPDATNIINVVEGGYEGITTSIQVTEKKTKNIKNYQNDEMR